jgi:ABC-2 type transport system ATP-binding protein/lipopolysaccharide transport system ATP-binding protein
VTFGLGFTTESGVQVAGPNSGYGEAAFSVVPGEGHVDFRLDELPLQPGEFLVTTAAVDKGHPYDFLDRAFVLKVRADDVTEPGLVKLTGNWSLGPATS